MNDGLLLRLLLAFSDRCGWLMRGAGVDRRSYRELLRLQYILDQRRLSRSDDPGLAALGNAALALMVILYVHIGFGLGMLSFLIDDASIFMVIASAGTLLFVTMPMVLDLERFLIGPADIDLIQPLPVAERTLLAVQGTHTLTLVLLIVASLQLPMLPMLAVNYGLFFVPLVLLAVALTALLGAATILLALVVALRTISFQRFSNALVWLQGGAALGFYLVLMVLPMIPMAAAKLGWGAGAKRVLVLLPPLWYGGLYRTLTGSGAALDAAMTVAGVGLPLAVVAALGVATRRGVVGKMAEALRAEATRSRPRRHGLSGRMGRGIADPLQRAGFGFFLANSTGDRKYLMRVWPVLLTLPAILLANGIQLRGSAVPLLAGLMVYVSMFVFMAVLASPYTQFPEAAWIFETLEEGQRRRVIAGATRALLARYLVVPLLFCLPVALLLGGVHRWAVTLLGSLLGSLLALTIAGLFSKYLPFAAPYGRTGIHSQILPILGYSTLILVVMGAVVGIGFIPYAPEVCVAIAAPAVWLRWRSLLRSLTA